MRKRSRRDLSLLSARTRERADKEAFQSRLNPSSHRNTQAQSRCHKRTGLSRRQTSAIPQGLALYTIMKTEDKHIECISDFCGNFKTNGAWADLYERPDGSRYVMLGGDWEQFGEHSPACLEDTDELFAPFLASCEQDEDFGFARQHWSEKGATS